jgi:amino acid transporter
MPVLPPEDTTPKLHRGLGLFQAVAMNMSNMVGVGPFLTIPLILSAMGGPQVLIGWILGALLALCDGMIWAELASAIPKSGGTFEYLKVAYAGSPLGRLLPFLFIWQFILSGPLEIASGTVGFSQYLTSLVPWTMDRWQVQLVAVAVTALAVLLLYRKIESVGLLMVSLWAGVVLTLTVILVSGLWHFEAAKVFDFPPGAFTLSMGFFLGLGQAMSMSMYDFLGYYSVCYIGDEVKAPHRNIPLSILIAVSAVAVIYLTLNVAIISVVPWQEAMKSEHIGTDFMARLYGPVGGGLAAALICWTAFASVFALMLGYSRIPYAAARDGFFFSVFGRLHPRADFPHVSLLVLGSVTMAVSFFSLEAVIMALMTTRILVQFVGQIGAVALIRSRGSMIPPFRMVLYPLPGLIALLGWLYIFATSGTIYIVAGLGSLAVGLVAFLVLSRLFNGEPRPR